MMGVLPERQSDYISDLKAKNARLQARVDNQEPWLVALGQMLVQYRIARFPEVC